MGSLLIQFHEARIADDIRYDDRHELALNALLHHGRSSYATVNISRMVASWMGGPARRPVSVIRVRTGLSALCPVYPATAPVEPAAISGHFTAGFRAASLSDLDRGGLTSEGDWWQAHSVRPPALGPEGY